LTPVGGPTIWNAIATISMNYLRVSLRGANDEELGKEVLYNEIYRGTSYGHNNYGTVSSLKKLSVGRPAEVLQGELHSGQPDHRPSGRHAVRVRRAREEGLRGETSGR
jgi:hypothetical protein